VTPDLHRVYLSLGSNITPEKSLRKAVSLLGAHSALRACSSAWESRAVGSEGPNFLNACVLITTPHDFQDLKKSVILPIEAELGRSRSEDKNAPRTIDIDILMMDDNPMGLESWGRPFVVVPLAEIAPDLRHPSSAEPLSELATRMRKQTWIKRRAGVLQRRIRDDGQQA